MGVGGGKGDPAADIGIVVSILDVSELFMGADDCDVISREGTGTGQEQEVPGKLHSNV